MIQFFFVDLSPAIPRAANSGISKEQRLHAFFAGALSAFVFCFLVPVVWTELIDRFDGPDERYLYFSDDVYNIVIYAFICPLYVGFGSVLMATVFDGGAELRLLQKKLNISQPGRIGQVWRTALFFFSTLAFTLILTVNYIADAVNLERVGVIYWFADEYDGAEVALNSLGVYYFIYNFTLLLFTVWSFMAFMTSFTAVTKVASALTRLGNAGLVQLSREEIEIKLKTFSYAYLFAKLQVAVYILNFWVWEKSPLGRSGNVVVAHVFLVIIGWICLSIPKHYIELQWSRYVHGFKGDDVSLRIESSLSSSAQLVLVLIDNILIVSVLALPYLSEFLSYRM